MRRGYIAAVVACALAGQVLLTAGVASAAGSGECQQEPRLATAQMCGDTSVKMYGVFVTFTYPSATYVGPPPGDPADVHNATEFFTDDAMTRSFTFGVKIHRSDSGSTYQPYWIDYADRFGYRNIGSALNAPDGKLHSFMAIPTCDNCAEWDILYDFEKVGTTGTRACHANCVSRRCTKIDLPVGRSEGTPSDTEHIVSSG